MQSTFGKNFNITIFGGSHEDMIGCRIYGFPKEALDFDHDELQHFLDLRAPGNSPLATSRKEPDRFEIPGADLSDEIERRAGSGASCDAAGDPFYMIIRNTDRRSGDYKNLRDVPRPGHADYTARMRYGEKLNMAGGGPFSARMTAPLCMAGGIALQYLERQGIKIGAHLLCAGDIYDRYFDALEPEIELALSSIRQAHSHLLPTLDQSAGEKMTAAILSAKNDLDSLGGIIEAAATGLPAGIGGCMYDGLESLLAPVYFGIPAVKGIEFGAGFAASHMRGSENNDAYTITNGKVTTATNNSGGILGGITTGMPFIARLAFKPTPSIAKQQNSVNLKEMRKEVLEIKGRHDPCVAVRAVPIVMAATALGILDAMLDK